MAVEMLTGNDGGQCGLMMSLRVRVNISFINPGRSGMPFWFPQ